MGGCETACLTSSSSSPISQVYRLMAVVVVVDFNSFIYCLKQLAAENPPEWMVVVVRGWCGKFVLIQV